MEEDNYADYEEDAPGDEVEDMDEERDVLNDDVSRMIESVKYFLLTFFLLQFATEGEKTQILSDTAASAAGSIFIS